MLIALSDFLQLHSGASVLSAATICAVSGWLLANVLGYAEGATGRSKAQWLVGAAVVAGVGVWTTHFMGMLGFRPDVVMSYDGARTFASALIAIIAVGGPLSLSALFSRLFSRAFLGGVAGLGIGFMHMTGMAALEGCSLSHSLFADLSACLVGAFFMGLWRILPRKLNTPPLASGLVVLAVCGAHFISLAGTTITSLQASTIVGHDQLTLSIFTAAGAGVLILGSFVALAATKRFVQQEEVHAAALFMALENMSNGILKVSSAEVVEIFNRRLATMLRVKADDLARGMSLAHFLHAVGRASGWDDARVGRVLANHRFWMTSTQETRVEHHFDDGRILAISCQPVPDGIVLTYDDVTKARQAQREISHMAFHDPLTGLANRRALLDKMVAGFSPRQRFKVLLIDLDRFKAVNDTFGHAVGDKLLSGVAERLQAVAGHEGFLARLGGDELAMLIYGDNQLAGEFARAIISAIEQPFDFEDFSVVVGCSIGICCADDANDPDDLMQRADVALYDAKRRSRGCAVFYQNGMIEAVAGRRRLESDLRVALSQGQLHLVYQPCMSLMDDHVEGYEALLRWTHPVRGAVSPAVFIPIAEETGLIVDIGRWVLEEACRQAYQWPNRQHVAVNVSPVQFRSPKLLAQVTAALARSGLPASRLEIELTETALVEDGPQIAHVLSDLRHLGIRVAMDDFGTGYSSLAHLRDLPLDRIKIDQSFVATALTDNHSMAVIKALIQMGRDMNILTLAEGVETSSQLDLLRTLGCNAVQGYLIGRPARQSLTESACPAHLAA